MLTVTSLIYLLLNSVDEASDVNCTELFASGPPSITVLSSATCTTDMAVVAVNCARSLIIIIMAETAVV